MSKAIYVCRRSGAITHEDSWRIGKVCKELEPDNISAEQPVVAECGDVVYGISNPVHSFRQDKGSLLVGQLIGDADGWANFQKVLDGSFALFRNNSDQLQVVADATASRTIWYYKDDDVFVASTSQRAIILFIGSFTFNRSVISWILSTGTLGPGASWDTRIQRLPPDATLNLDKKCWVLHKDEKRIEFRADSEGDHSALLTETIRASFTGLKDLAPEDWVIPLSGGYDSRAILYFLQEQRTNENLEAITWGLESAVNRPRTDAAVAKKVADRFGVRHRYFPTDDREEDSVETIVERFIRCGEGRIDHISGYTDGFRIWKTLFENGVRGVVRGDEGFGWVAVGSPAAVRMTTGCALCTDYSNLQEIVEVLELPRQELPDDLMQRADESLEAWRDRLYHAYRLPTLLAALSDLKLGYVEQIAPLVSRTILQCVRRLPDSLRTNKRLFRQVVDRMVPDIEYATEGATGGRKDILRKQRFVEFLEREIQESLYLRRHFPESLLDQLASNLAIEARRSESFGKVLRRKLRKVVPQGLIQMRRARGHLPLDSNILGFRVCLISRVLKLFDEDAHRLRK